MSEVELLYMYEDWLDPLSDTIPGEGVIREKELLQVPEDWADPLPDTVPVNVLSERRSSSRCRKTWLIPT